jgi:hypothetical protein
MPDFQTITPPFWRGWILIECGDGKTYKYVRTLTKRATKGTSGPGWYGDSISTDYIFGDSLGDSLPMTGDTGGRILFDFNRLASNFQTQMSISAGQFLKWPELGGDTALLKRLNREQLQPLSSSTPNQSQMYQIPGDTLGYRLYNLAAYTYLRLAVGQVQSISLIQERIPLWYANQQGANASLYYPNLR